MSESPDAVVSREAARMRDEYDRRDKTIPTDVYEPTRPENLWRLQQRMRWSTTLLRAEGLVPLASRRILDVGCGTGLWLAEFNALGVPATHLHGLDLLENRVAGAKRRFGIETNGAGDNVPDIRLGDATQLPWADNSFDIVMQSTVFSSISSDEVQARIAAEMLRVLAPAGVVLWYDFRVSNPRNHNVRGINKDKLRRLFPQCGIRSHVIGLAPPIARRLVPRARMVAELLESARFLNVYYIATIRPTKATSR